MRGVLGLAVTLILISSCSKEAPPIPVGPAASSLASSRPATAGAKRFSVEPAQSKIEFVMDAPKEKIRGRVSQATQGEIHIDPYDLAKTSGRLVVDISGLELYQTVADESGKFSEEQKSDTQNKHARTWLEISDDAPPDVRKANSNVAFAVSSVERVSEKDLSKLSGSSRRVDLTVTGDFLLHGHKATKTVDLEATFAFEGERPVRVDVRTKKPFAVSLAEHEVKPREAFGKLAQKTLEVLSPKVAKEALVSLEFRAKLAP